jgi:NAD(P)-dependent dehydrogenase (short-subunit alcohol dehydrogenase family)
MELRHKVALITGGARIGISVAEELARKGVNISLSYRSSKLAADEAKKKVEIMGTRAQLVKGDMANEKDVKRVIQETVDTFGRLDIIINMVSIYEKTPWSTLNEENWQENIDANLKPAYLIALHAQKYLAKSGGRIIHISDWISASGRPRYKDYIPYYTAKSGLIGLAQAQALELAPEILVNVIAPGPILPPRGASQMEIDEVIKVTPLKKWGGELEIAKAAVFLCETDFVTGECVRVDGGRHLY